MRAQEVLAAWLKARLGLREVWTDAPAVREDLLPGAAVRFQHTTAGDVLDAGVVTETYRVLLLVPTVGATPAQVAERVSALEELLAVALRSTERVDAAWVHIAGERDEAAESGSLWTVRAVVRAVEE